MTVAWSKELRAGIPVEEIVAKHRQGGKYPPSGVTNHPYVRTYNSLSHLIWGIVGLEYLGPEKFADITGEEIFRDRVKHPENLRFNKNMERIRFEKYMKQIHEIDRVMTIPLSGKQEEAPKLIVNGNGSNGDEKSVDVEETNQNHNHNGSRREACPGCGAILPGAAGCSYCNNCGRQIGGGCPA